MWRCSEIHRNITTQIYTLKLRNTEQDSKMQRKTAKQRQLYSMSKTPLTAMRTGSPILEVKYL